AEELARLKNTFVANVSHELRTPLAVMLGYAELMLPEARGEDRVCLEAIVENGRRLSGTLTVLLELAQLEGCTLHAAREDVDLTAAARDVVLIYRARAAARGLSIELKAPQEPVEVRLDRARLLRVLDN